MILVNVNVLTEHVFALANEIEAFDSHVGGFGILREFKDGRQLS
jgi:hypothetical protein